MDKLILLVGKESDSDFKIIASWNFIPKQETIDYLISQFTEKYESFALMQDILFINGSKTEVPDYTDNLY